MKNIGSHCYILVETSLVFLVLGSTFFLHPILELRLLLRLLEYVPAHAVSLSILILCPFSTEWQLHLALLGPLQCLREVSLGQAGPGPGHGKKSI